MIRLTLWVSIFLSICTTSGEDLSSAMVQFDGAIEKLNSGRERELLRISGLYKQRLDQLQTVYQRRGDLDATLEVMEEKKRVQETPLQLPADPSGLPKLKQLHLAMEKAFEAEQHKSAVAMEVLLEKMDAHLESLQIGEVQSGRIEEAREIKEAREALPDRQDVRRILAWKIDRKPPHPDAVVFQGRHFLVVTEKLTYSNAEKWCKENGGRLAVVPDQATADFLQRIRPEGAGRLFFGISDREKEGEWRWSNGRVLDRNGFAPWNPGEPNNTGAGGEHVAEIVENGMWNDVSSGQPKSFICEWP